MAINSTSRFMGLFAGLTLVAMSLTGCAPASTTADPEATPSVVREAAISCPEQNSDDHYIEIRNNLNVDIKFFSELSSGCRNWSGVSNPTTYNGTVVPSGGSTGLLRLEHSGDARWSTTFMLMTGNIITTINLEYYKQSGCSDQGKICHYYLRLWNGSSWSGGYASVTLNDIDGSGSGGIVSFDAFRTLTFTCKDKSVCPSS